MNRRRLVILIAALHASISVYLLEELNRFNWTIEFLDDDGNPYPTLRSRDWYERIVRHMPPLQFQSNFRLHLITFKKLLEMSNRFGLQKCPGIGAPGKLIS